MSLSPLQIVYLAAFVLGYGVAVVLIDRMIAGAPRARAVFRWVVAGITLGAYFLAVWGIDLPGRRLHVRTIFPGAQPADINKGVIAGLAAFSVFYERYRVGIRRPVSERWKRFVAITLALSALVSYFGVFRIGYPKFYHRWDQYHYYMGAKYFRELGYDGLYRCAVIAEDEMGTISYDDGEHVYLEPGRGRRTLDLRREVRQPDKKIRDLGGDNLIKPAAPWLEHPEICKDHFSAARWEEYKADVAFWRVVSEKGFWDDMLKDHGYNPPPVWTVGGYLFASAYPPGHQLSLPIIGAFNWAQALSMIDLIYGAAMFAAVFWAFGYRAFAVAAIVWGCEAAAPAFWTQGAFLRQDWLFWLVFSVCLAKKRYHALAGASLVYAALLRIFPGLVVFGWLAMAGHHLLKKRTLSRPQWRTLAGGTLAAVILIPASLKVAGPDAYQAFYHHTLQVHDRTPLTNHMGLRVLVSQKVFFEIPELGVGVGPSSGRMKYTRDNKLDDPFEVWKDKRNERYDQLRPVAWGITALTLAYFFWMMRRRTAMWMGPCLGVIFIILMSQLTNYYYVFLILLAPLTRVNRRLEVPLFGFALLSQIVFGIYNYNDDKYWVLTALSLALCYGVLWSFTPAADRARFGRLFRGLRGAT